MLYSVQLRDRIFVKRYGFLCFVKNMGKNIGKNISISLSGKCSPGILVMRQKFLDYVKKSATDALKTSSKRFTQKPTEAAGDLIVNKIANKITRVSKNSQQNNSETFTNEHDKEIPKGRYVSPEERQGIIGKLRLK